MDITKYRLQKICLNEYLTCRVSEHPSKKTWEMCRETVGI